MRVYSQDVGTVSSYVRPVIRVSEDAYVFAVMMDLDGRIQVLHPEFPGISVRIRSNKQLSLPNFFAAYNDPRQSGRYSGLASYDGYDSDGDARGTVIAIASRAPFNLDLIDAGGDWNISVIRQLIEDRAPESAARSLANYLAAKGEPVGHDFMRFAGRRQGYYAYNGYNGYSAYDYCGYSSYSRFGGYYGLPGLGSAAALRAAGLRPLFLGYDACGLPIIVVSPFTRGGRFPLPHPQRPPGDTTVFPKSRFPTGVTRHPGADNVPQGIFPLPQRGELPQTSEFTVPAPQRRRAEPRETLEQFRPQPDRSSFPDRARMPVERTVPRAEPVSSGMRPVYRPEPAVAAPATPVRAPERVYRDPPPREAPPRMAAPAPAPVVYERPAPPPPPPPPPPRTQSEPQSKPVPTPRS